MSPCQDRCANSNGYNPAYPCPQPPYVVIAPPAPSDGGAQGIVTNQPTSGTPAATPGFALPTMAAGATVPALSGIATMNSTGASAWATPGLLIWLAAYNGYLAITGVTGDLITFRNLSITPGTVLGAGTQLVPFAPPQSVEGVDPTAGAALDTISGIASGLPTNLGGTLGQMLLRGASAWIPTNANPLQIVPGQPSLLVVKRDVLRVDGTHPYPTGNITASTVSLAWGTTVNVNGPNWGGGASGVPAPSGVTFPSPPTPQPGQVIRALVQCNWKMASEVAGSPCLEITFGTGASAQTVYINAYCPAVSDALANLSAGIRNKGPSGSFMMVIPVPANNAALPVATYVSNANTTVGTPAAATVPIHYVAQFNVVAWIL